MMRALRRLKAAWLDYLAARREMRAHILLQKAHAACPKVIEEFGSNCIASYLASKVMDGVECVGQKK